MDCVGGERMCSACVCVCDYVWEVCVYKCVG